MSTVQELPKIEELATSVLIDPWSTAVIPAQGRVVEVALMPGATDPDAELNKQVNLGLPRFEL